MTEQKRTVGFDSKRAVIKGQIKNEDGTTKDFNYLFGVGVSVSEYDTFVSAYEKSMQESFAEAGLEMRRPIYKGSDLKKIFYSSGIDVFGNFIKNVAPTLSAVDYYFSYFCLKDETGKPQWDSEFIDVFYDDPTKRKKIKPIEFINLIQESYPVFCAWKYIQDVPHITNRIYLDNVGIRPCSSWKGLKANKNVNIVYHGDRCNHLISTADILASYLEEKIRKDKIKIRQIGERIPELRGKIFGHPEWSTCMYNLSPAKDYLENTIDRILRPVVYIFTGDRDKFAKMFGQVNMKDFILESTLGDALITKASKEGMSIKFYEPNDNQLIKKDDFFASYDGDGTAKIEYLQSLGYKNKIIEWDKE
jgi:hypothetical protein